MRLTNILLGIILTGLTSCKVYNSHFECPPSPGVPCTPLTTLEKMIVETPEGNPDIFLGFVPDERCSQVNQQRYIKKNYIPGEYKPCKDCVEGQYFYIPSE